MQWAFLKKRADTWPLIPTTVGIEVIAGQEKVQDVCQWS